MADIRVFVAHARSLEGDQLLSIYATILAKMVEKNPGKTVEVTMGRDDYSSRAMTPQGGKRMSWEAWAKSISAMCCPGTSEPRFNVIVIPVTQQDEPIGKATAQIIQFASKQGSQSVVTFHRGDFHFEKLVELNEAAGDRDFKGGWTVRSKPF